MKKTTFPFTLPLCPDSLGLSKAHQVVKTFSGIIKTLVSLSKTTTYLSAHIRSN